MRRILITSILLLLVACATEEEKVVGGTGGVGGAGGTLAPGGAGGSGGIAPVDLAPPVIDIDDPADGTLFEEPEVTIRGRVTDDVGVTRLWWIAPGGKKHELPADRSGEIPLAIDMLLDEGENEILIGAQDEAGNSTEFRLSLRYENTPGRAPQIVLFEPVQAWAEQGDSVELHWKVTGTRPIDLHVITYTNQIINVTGQTSATVRLLFPNYEYFVLDATSDLGRDVAVAVVSLARGRDHSPGGAAAALRGERSRSRVVVQRRRDRRGGVRQQGLVYRRRAGHLHDHSHHQ